MTAPQWTPELLADPHQQADKRSRVQKMFASIAKSYDLNNRLHSFGRDQAWRRKAVRIAELKPLDRVVDVACGTGDLALLFDSALARFNWWREPRWSAVQTTGVIGIDFTFSMVALAKLKDLKRDERYLAQIKKIDRRRGEESEDQTPSENVRWITGDAQALPVPDACCDVLSIAFGIRNVQSVPTALAEFYRVLRPGGRLIVLEFARPKNRLIRLLNDLYTTKIMPRTATLISGDKTGAYAYLPKSVETFIDRAEMTRLIRSTGFNDISEHAMTFGTCVCYRGVKSE